MANLTIVFFSEGGSECPNYNTYVPTPNWDKSLNYWGRVVSIFVQRLPLGKKQSPTNIIESNVERCFGLVSGGMS